MATQVIVVGGGLAGLSAAHTAFERGANVLLLDKNPFMGGNSTKATSGINAALTRSQQKLNIADSYEIFYNDTAKSAGEGLREPLVKVLCAESAPGVEWLIERFGLDLSLVSRLGGHSQPRTHRGKERFPGMTITMALMEKFEELSKSHPDRAKILTKAKVTGLLQNGDGGVRGVTYCKDGQTFEAEGPVVICTGGFAADFTPNSLLDSVKNDWRSLTAWKPVKQLPDLISLPTTNGDHCTGDGIKISVAIGAKTCDMEAVQVHPTGLVHPDEPDSKLKFLAAEALRGVGGLLLDRHGKRFCDELGKRDYVTGCMWNSAPPFRLVLNGKAGKEIEWHCKHYCGRGLMKYFKSGNDLAKEMNLNSSDLKKTFDAYNECAKKGTDEFGKRFYSNAPFVMEDEFWVAIVTPVVHYCMGGLEADHTGNVVGGNGSIPGLFAAGEVMGGVHGKNRLGGNSLLDCVAFGRVSGASAASYLLNNAIKALSSSADRRVAAIARQLEPGCIGINIDTRNNRMEISWAGGATGIVGASAATQATASQSSPADAASPAANAPAAADRTRKITMAEVAQHNKESDCWVVVNGQVLDVTKFLPDHPGGKKAILLFAGKDASEEFNMLHKPDVVQKYCPESIIGVLQA